MGPDDDSEIEYGGHKYKDGVKYVGSWNRKGLKSGGGHILFPDGTRYDGNFENGFFNGQGVLSFPDGAKYEGEFLQGWFHGHGIFLRADGMRYEGEFRGGKMRGLGLITFSDYSHGFPKLEGYFENCRLLKKQSCPETVLRAHMVSITARKNYVENI
ncbi:unnamed protein product [Brassicogethes aeneus]|uniref:MORN repeat-containing protein 4 n=1 Tax=Brassicogethes aeneus TaxID=1431903 RepID=A0A9P0FKV8_BRAAE|nr:unnamed protein product [Brassicogethes aeneus]